MLEVCALLAVVWHFNIKFSYVYWMMDIIGLICVAVISYGRDNPLYMLAWAVTILAFPPFGVLIYLLAGTHYLSPAVKNRIKQISKLNRDYGVQNRFVREALKKAGGNGFRQAEFVRGLSLRPVYEYAGGKYLTPGEKMNKAMLEALEQAQKFIFIEYFIIADGKMWNGIYEILRKKAETGVEVRIIYDDAGSMDELPLSIGRKSSDRFKTAAFNPFKPVLNKLMNYRDHRKITVIDGKTGFLGGINIADEYINQKVLHGHWKDTAVEVDGDCVYNLTKMFLDMWAFITGELPDFQRYRVESTGNGEYGGSGFVLPFDDGPLMGGNIAEGAYMQMINMATRYVYIMTPYLITDNEMLTALRNAALSGIDVKIITPHIGDKWYAYTITRAYYGRLLESGVKIYEYTPGFVHSKVILCDDDTAIVGSVNMDFRSFYLQFECAVWFYQCEILEEIKADFSDTLESSGQIDPAQWAKRPFYVKLLEMLLRLIAPLM